ncbi:hypothetical protein LP7551_02388 [Roseibium album]|nr:hypothetical protein LP7551_02388 [Roseibium album]
MARFPYYQRNVKELGRLLANAALDQELRKSLGNNPSDYLSKIGLPKKSIELLTFKVVDQNCCPNAVALPFRLSDEKLENGNTAYLQRLSTPFRLN